MEIPRAQAPASSGTPKRTDCHELPCGGRGGSTGHHPRRRTSLSSQVVGLAPERDLAVLRLMDPPADLTELPLGNSLSYRSGERSWPSAIRSGWIHSPSASSAPWTRNTVSQQPHIRGVIQTDAAINPVTQAGAAEFSRTIGRREYRHLFAEWWQCRYRFAIPVNTVIEVVPQLIAFGRSCAPCWVSTRFRSLVAPLPR